MNRDRARWMPFALAGLGLLVLFTGCGGGGGGDSEMSADAKVGQDVFTRNCTACHTVGGGDGIGPDLVGIHDRRDAEWLYDWIDDPIGMAKTDPIGQEILAQWNNIPMSDSNLAGKEIDQVLAYIEHASDAGGMAIAQEAPMELDDATFVEHDTQMQSDLEYLDPGGHDFQRRELVRRSPGRADQGRLCLGNVPFGSDR